MIFDHGSVSVPNEIVAHAETIKFENYKTNTPAKFQKHVAIEKADGFVEQIAKIANRPVEKIDWVYFSVCKGAEPHIDQLSDKFEDTTFVIPVILPTGKSTITADGVTTEVKLNKVYEFDHTKLHSMELEDTESGCVVIMAAPLV